MEDQGGPERDEGAYPKARRRNEQRQDEGVASQERSEPARPRNPIPIRRSTIKRTAPRVSGLAESSLHDGECRAERKEGDNQGSERHPAAAAQEEVAVSNAR